MLFDGRSSLPCAAALGLLAALLSCGPGAPRSGAGAGGDTGATIPGPPTLSAGPGGAAHLLAPMDERPVAYLSRAEMRVYVDRSYLDWAQSRLGAYVSVTTGLWRIRRPEDDPGVPIIPGDTLREFEVVDISEWDPTMPPVEGDARLRLGAPLPVHVDLPCAPIRSDEGRESWGWVTARGVAVHRRDGLRGQGGREAFVEVAKATRHLAEGCEEEGETARLLTWTVPAGDLDTQGAQDRR